MKGLSGLASLTGLGGKGALQIIECRTNARMDRNPTGEATGRFAAQLRISHQVVGKITRDQRITGIVWIATVQRTLPPNRAVEQPGIEMRQAEMRGEGLGDGAFARSSGAIDGDDHARAILFMSSMPDLLSRSGSNPPPSRERLVACH